MPPLVRYGVPALLGVVALTAGLLLSGLPSLLGDGSQTFGVVLFFVGAALILAALTAAYLPRPSRQGRPPSSPDGDPVEQKR